MLVLAPDGDGHAATLYCEPNPGKTDKTFFTDRVKGELWVGPRLGLEQTAATLRRRDQAARARSPTISRALRARAPFRALRGIDPALDASLPAQRRTRRARSRPVLSEMRLIKDELEIRELRRAIDATQRGFDDVVRALPDARRPSARSKASSTCARASTGNDVGYATIAASGPNACTLHWTRNDRRIGENELLLLDAGVEAETLYTADITRTIPISGRFTPEQREIYELVLAAQDAGFARVRARQRLPRAEPRGDAGARARPRAARHPRHRPTKRCATRTSSTGATRCTTSATCSASTCTTAPRRAPRRTSSARCAREWCSPSSRGSTSSSTISRCRPRYRGIGVRIEDDVLITEDGVDILSAAIPRTADDVEAWVSRSAHQPPVLA